MWRQEAEGQEGRIRQSSSTKKRAKFFGDQPAETDFTCLLRRVGDGPQFDNTKKS